MSQNQKESASAKNMSSRVPKKVVACTNHGRIGLHLELCCSFFLQETDKYMEKIISKMEQQTPTILVLAVVALASIKCN